MFGLFKKQSRTIVEPHPQAYFHHFSTLGRVYINSENVSEPYRRAIGAIQQLVFPKFICGDMWEKQLHRTKLQAISANLSAAHFYYRNLREYMQLCQFEQTQELQLAAQRLKSIDFAPFHALSDEILLAIPEQFQIILSTRSNHPRWQPPDVIDVTATRVNPLMLG